MKKYCFDTSGFSTPLEQMPDDIYRLIWRHVVPVVERGNIAVNSQIYDELEGSLHGLIGTCVDNSRTRMLLEIGSDDWAWSTYVNELREMEVRQARFLRENKRGRSKTVGLNDISIIALAKTLNLPLVSMERSVQPATDRRQIPDVCNAEGVTCIQFNEFLRRENIRFE